MGFWVGARAGGGVGTSGGISGVQTQILVRRSEEEEEAAEEEVEEEEVARVALKLRFYSLLLCALTVLFL